jgi:hypothetical protein
MWRKILVVIVLALLSCGAAAAQSFEFLPGAKYDPAIPTLKQVVGHDWGENITLHSELVAYLRALEKASPKVRVVEYARTWQGRPLHYVIISAEQNLARLEEVKAGMKRLADPRATNEADANRLISSLPAVTWLAYGVHGNEISSSDAALRMAYHLVAAQNDDLVAQILRDTIVIIDPAQNPDGRDRFINHFRGTVGRWPDADQQAAERIEPWPSGRSNHYLFDMNRDWFAQTQPETRGRVRIYQEWFPVVFVDLHEMGSNSTYYFAPPALPYNPNLFPEQHKWLETYGRNNARWFDRFRFDYYTREVFDSFYPGYGEGWPMFHGSIGMTYEQASARGLVVRRSDDTEMHYRDSVQHHFISSLATAETTAKNREALLRHFYEFRRSAVREGQQGAVKEFILAPGNDPNRATKLAALLVTQGIEVKRAEAPFTNARVRDYDDKSQSREFPAGTYVVSLAQPAMRLVKTLLEKHTPMDKEFIDEQVRRRKQRLPDEIYDITAWSLPLIFGVDAYTSEQPSQGNFTTLSEPPRPAGKLHGGRAHLAYLIPWGSNSAAQALADLLRQEVRVAVTHRPVTLGGIAFPRGTLVVRVKDNPGDLHARIERAVADYGIEVHATSESWVEAGVNLGSDYVRHLKPPKIALAWNDPTSSLSAGWARFVLERQYGLPVTLLHARLLGRADLSRYNVLILPSASGFLGGYADALGESGAQRIKSWVQAGGTLITFGEATRWLTDEKVALLATQREMRDGRPEREERPGGAVRPSGPPASTGGGQGTPGSQPPAPGDAEKAILPERELPEAIPGAILRVEVDGEHWLGFGYAGSASVLVDSRNIYTPLKLDRGRNVARYAASDRVLRSGWAMEESLQQIGGKAWLMHQPAGRGSVIAFAEDPNFRAFCDGLNLFVLNGIFFAPRP